MISTLHIKNIGIIDELNVDLNSGFNVFTGETGAGKTLIIDALNIISGGRFSKEMIRKGEDFSFVELNLFLPENELSLEGNIIVSREIHTNGRNSCKINGRLVTVSELKEFMNDVIDIHGQNDNQRILNPKNHIKYLDNFSGEDFKKVLKNYKDLYTKYSQLKKELKENLGDDKEKQRQLDLLQYEFDEIEKANLKEDEDTKLYEKSIMFQNAEKIEGNLNNTKECSESAINSINNAIKSMNQISNIDDKYCSKLSELKNIYYEIEEFSRDLSDQSNDVYFDEDERNEVEERLDLIANLKRKYGNSIHEINEYKDKIEQEINRINNLDEHNNQLKIELKEITTQLSEIANKLHEERIKNIKLICEKINRELKDLEMSNAKFDVEVRKTELNKRGIDDIQFMISTNIGEDKKELDKIASGGEMSRIMLAIKTVLANTDKIPVMIFDEIDVGISGKAAKSVGEKLKLIGKSHQVICITHQPSIAAKGDENYFISKENDGNRTHTVIKHLEEAEVIDEIARISNGEITEIARQHARELRKVA